VPEARRGQWAVRRARAGLARRRWPTEIPTARRGEETRIGPNKPPKGRGGSNFGKNRQQEGKAKGPLKERLSGRMFSVDEDSRFSDDDSPVVDVEIDIMKKDDVDLEVDKEDDKEKS
jgi:hypothetical protein